MRLMVLLSCAFLLGWMLSWMYYAASTDTASTTPAGLVDSLPPANQAPPPPVLEEAVNALRGSDEALPGKGPVSALDLTRDRLQRGEFEAVMAEYPVIQGRLSRSDAAIHQQIIVEHARWLQQSGRPVLARVLLGLYLQYEYRDVSALLLMADIYRSADNAMEAIEIMFQAKSYAYTPSLVEQTETAIRATVKTYNAQLLAQKDSIAQLNLYKRLIELEPEYSLHFIGLAETYLALGNTGDARKALQLTQHDSAVKPQADDIIRRIEAQMEPDRYYEAEVSIQALGNQFLVEALLNDSERAVLLLDTGASLSIVSTDLMTALGLANQPASRMAWFSTAGGRVKAPIVRLERLALDGVAVENVEVGVIGEFDDYRFDGLLGMNFLRHFEFFINQNESKLQLNPHGG